jgi:hypothetical protein
MLKIYLLIFIIAAGFSVAVAQTDSLSAKDKAMLDSMMENDEFLKMMSENDKSYFDFNISFSNQFLSLNNNNVNAGQLKSKFVLIPTFAYHNKSGLGIELSDFLTSDSGNFKGYQYAISPFFKTSGKSFDCLLSYTRYLPGRSSNASNNPFQNDFFANVKYVKKWLKPNFSIGITSGKFDDTINLAGTVRNVKIKISDFSLSPSVEHDFYFYNVFSKKDELSLTPTLLVVAGSQQLKTLGSKRLASRPRIKALLKNRFESNTGFALQSIASSINLVYQINKFYFNPNLYIDYYLPDIAQKKLSTLFSIVIGVSF